jgi:hypothetical protein
MPLVRGQENDFSDPANYFSGSMEHKNETFLTSRKRLFMESASLANYYFSFGRPEMPLERGCEKDLTNRLRTQKRHFFSFD